MTRRKRPNLRYGVSVNCKLHARRIKKRSREKEKRDKKTSRLARCPKKNRRNEATKKCRKSPLGKGKKGSH